MAWFVATLLVAAAAIALGFSLGWHNARRSLPTIEPQPAVAEKDERTAHRAVALDSVEEAVLVADCEGRIRDCNSSALTLFDRHRDEVEDQYTSTLRRFDGQDQSEPHRLASEHSVWVGEAWVKQPDGGMKLCQVRLMAIRDERARIVAFAESYQPVVHDRNVEQEVRNLLYGVRTFETSGSRDERLSQVLEELRVLSEGFRDLDHVMRQYERILPSLSADDPLTESIAGVAADARAAVTAVGVPALLEEIPRALSRLRAHLQSLTPDETETDAVASSANAPRTGQGGRRA
jgi:PAS domain S-box-containing protein